MGGRSSGTSTWTACARIAGARSLITVATSSVSGATVRRGSRTPAWIRLMSSRFVHEVGEAVGLDVNEPGQALPCFRPDLKLGVGQSG